MKTEKPTPEEIQLARASVGMDGADNYSDSRSAMAEWEGDGWHTHEVYYGILVGMEIQRNRLKKGKG